MDDLHALTATLAAYTRFDAWLHKNVLTPKRIKYNLLLPREQQLLPHFAPLLANLKQCIDINAAFTRQLAHTAALDWDVPTPPDAWPAPLHADFDKVRLTLLQLAREWSHDGAAERQQTFGRIVAEVALRCEPRSKVLVPGCGTGRLVFELVRAGFWTQGNEVSYHMLLALGFVLNRMPQAHEHTIFPYIFKLLHLHRRLHQVRPLTIPDVSAMLIFDAGHDAGELMLMAAGSFVDLYGPPDLAADEAYSADESAAAFRGSNKGAFAAVATCFFLDTAHNVIDYIKTIHHCLQDGGLWINVGPLLWHWEGDASTQMVTRAGQEVQSIMEGMELSREELFALIESLGFVFEKQELGIETTYSGDPKAMGNFVYQAEFWVARKI